MQKGRPQKYSLGPQSQWGRGRLLAGNWEEETWRGEKNGYKSELNLGSGVKIHIGKRRRG